MICLLVGFFNSQQHASVSQGRICSIVRAATLEIEVAGQTVYLTRSLYTDTGLTSQVR